MFVTNTPSNQETAKDFGMSFKGLSEVKTVTNKKDRPYIEQFYELNPDYDNFSSPLTEKTITNNITRNIAFDSINQDLIPRSDVTFNIGTSDLSWLNVYAQNYNDEDGNQLGIFKTLNTASGSAVATLNDDTATFSSSDTTILTSASGKTVNHRVNRNKIQSKTHITVGFSDYNDYVCDGARDDIQIQQAINAIASNSNKGSIWFEDGTYVIGATISIPKDCSVAFYGKETKLNPLDSNQGGVWWLGNSSLTALIESKGNAYVSAVADLSIGSARFYNMNLNAGLADYLFYGLNIDSPRFYNCRLTGANVTGVYMAFNGNTPLPGAEAPGGLYAINCTIGIATAGAVIMDFEYCTQCWIIGCWFEGSICSYAVKMKSCNKIAFIGCEFNTASTALIEFSDTADDKCDSINFTGCKFACNSTTVPLVEDNRSNVDSFGILIHGTNFNFQVNANSYWQPWTNVIDVSSATNSHLRNPIPAFSSTPTITAITATTATYNATIDGFGTTFFVILPSGATVPTAYQVMQGFDSTNTLLPANRRGKTVHREDETVTSNLTGLTTVTTYDVYCIRRSQEKIISPTTKVTFTTI